MAEIRWTVAARADLQEIREYIGRDSRVYAAATVRRITTAVKRLCRFPRLGRVVPEYEDETLRELIVGNYRVVYRIHGKIIGIVAVIHGSRDLPRRLNDEPWNFG
ncbi:MAG: type II toxin-antitoxin system RelE/ParE family toxin [Armatimonadetes bacterium]|nr:type II toxin-antitoxin system RelE/ParE family toxin [Armatimonadota bacterium]